MEERPGQRSVLKRDGAEVVLQDGRIWLLSPVNGRTIGVAFQGNGVFGYDPAWSRSGGRW